MVGVRRLGLVRRGLRLEAVDLGQKVVRGQPVVVGELGEVAADAVGQHDDDGVALAEAQVLDGADHGRHRGAGAAADQQALLGDQPARELERLAVLGLVPLVDDLAVEHIGDEVVADALDLVALVHVLLVERLGQGEDAAVGVCGDDLDILVVLLEAAGDAGDGAAGAGAGDDGGDGAVGLVPDLLGGAELVGERVVEVAVLVEDVGVGDLLLEAAGDADVRLGAVPGGLGRGADDGGAEGLEDGDFLGGHLLGEGDDGLVALDRADERQADTTGEKCVSFEKSEGGQCCANVRVAAGGLDEGVAGLDAAALLGLLDHAQGYSVLDAAASVEELDLGVHLGLDSQALGDLVQTNERSVANELSRRQGGDGHSGGVDGLDVAHDCGLRDRGYSECLFRV